MAVEQWELCNGNKCFRFSERRVFERPWILVLAVLVLIVCTGIEYYVYGFHYCFSVNTVILFFLFLLWISLPMRANKAIIEKTVHKLMDEKVAMDAKTHGTEVVKSFVHYDVKGTCAFITKRCFLVLLKNGVVWEYFIEYHDQGGNKRGYYECGSDFIIAESLEHIHAIRPGRLHRLVSEFKLSDNTKLWLSILAIILVGGVVFAGMHWLVLRLKWRFLLLMGGYFVLYEMAEWLARLRPGKLAKAFKRAVLLPIIFLYSLVAFVQPFLIIVLTYCFIALYAFFVPYLVLKGIVHLGWVDLKPELIVFFVIVLGSVLSSTYSVTKWIIRHTPLKNWDNNDYEFHREQLAFYLAHPSNMVFLIYLVYFVILAVSGYMLIQNSCYLISESFDLSVLKAFLVYIAYTNMTAKAKNTEIEANVLLHHFSELYMHEQIK